MITTFLKFKGLTSKAEYAVKDIQEFGKYFLQIIFWHAKERVKEMLEKASSLINKQKLKTEGLNTIDLDKQKLATAIDRTAMTRNVKNTRAAKEGQQNISPLQAVLKLIVKYGLNNYEKYLGGHKEGQQSPLSANKGQSNDPNSNYSPFLQAEQFQGPKVALEASKAMPYVSRTDNDQTPEEMSRASESPRESSPRERVESVLQQ